MNSLFKPRNKLLPDIYISWDVHHPLQSQCILSSEITLILNCVLLIPLIYSSPVCVCLPAQ